MTRFDLQFLRIGDRVVINKGKNKGREAIVLDILGSHAFSILHA